MAIDMKKILQDAIQAFQSGASSLMIAGKSFPIRFIHDNQYPQYGVMTPLGEVIRLVVYSPNYVEAYPA